MNSVWAASYIPTAVKTISASQTFIINDIQGTTEKWFTIPSRSMSDKSVISDPDGDIDVPTGNQKCLQVKADGGVFNSSKRVIHMLVTGITGIKAIGQANDGRGFQIGATEYTSGMSENTEMNVVAGYNSAQNPVSYSGLDSKKTYIISVFAYNSDTYLYAVRFTAPAASKPVFTKQPSNVETVVNVGTTLSVTAVASKGDISYKWYSCDDANKTNAVEITGATSDSYNVTKAVAGDYHFFCEATDDNGTTSSDVAKVTVINGVAPTITITANATSLAKGRDLVLKATMEGTPVPTVQWYSNTSASNAGGTIIDGATNATYYPSTSTAGTYYYYAVSTNMAGTTASAPLTITVTDAPANTIYCHAYLTAMSNAPRISNCSFEFWGKATDSGPNNVPAGEVAGDYYQAKMNSNDNFYKVILADGTKTTFEAGDVITIYLYGNSTTGGYKVGSVNSAVSETITKGEITGVSHTLTANEIESDGTLRIYRNSSNTYFAGIKVEGTRTVPVTVPVTIAASGYTSIASAYALDFANAEDGEGNKNLTAFAVTSITKTSVTLTSVESAPAETGLILKGTASTAYTIPVTATPASVSVNELSAAVAATPVEARTVYAVSGGQLKLFTGTEVPAGKAYLLASKVPAEARGMALSFDEEELTGISNVDGVKPLLEGDFYNISGQRVAKPGKGMYIVNGKKVIIK